MLYKTIVLELLQQQTELHEQLRLTRRLKPTLETCARELKASHDAWNERLSQEKWGSDPSRISSEALEMAIQELVDRLPTGNVSDGGELSLDQTMASARAPSSRD